MTNRCPGERRDQAKFGHRKAMLFKSCLRDILSAEAKRQIFKKIYLCAGFKRQWCEGNAFKKNKPGTLKKKSGKEKGLQED